MENLLQNHIYTVLGITGLVSMILTGCAIQLGDVLFKRFQRAQLKRELGKVQWHKVIPAILLSFSLLTSQMAFGQTAPPPKATPDLQYQRLILAVSTISQHMKRICKTEECTAVALEGIAFAADAREKQKNGLLVNGERDKFHENLKSLMERVRSTLTKQEEKEHPNASHLDKMPECATCAKLKAVVFDEDRCDMCYQVFENAAEICALYLGICETCALICLSVATLQFGNCIKRFCDGT